MLTHLYVAYYYALLLLYEITTKVGGAVWTIQLLESTRHAIDWHEN